MKPSSLKLVLFLLVWICFLHPASLQAQSARSLYFMDNAPARLNLNPALQPLRGYFNIPVIGGIGATVVSDPLSVQDFMDILSKENGFLENDKLYDKLKNMNNVSMDLSMDLISFGFYSGKGFWTVNIGTKILLSTSIPKSMFDYARDADHIMNRIDRALAGQLSGVTRAEIDDLLNTRFEVKDLRITADAFAELGVGYSRAINDRLTVGGKIKVLVGMVNLDAHVNQMSMHINNDRKWQVETRGSMNVSMKGLNLGTKDGDGYIDDFDFDSPGIGGFGGGIDLGASYNIWNDLTLSASIMDLGFINWSKTATTTATTNSNHSYDPATMEGSEIFNFDLIQFQTEEGQKKRTTSLRPMLNIGAEYTFLSNKIGIGMLYSNRFQKPENFSELTLSANFRPKNWFGATVSYSFLHSDFKTFGLGLKLGPIFLATDYMITGDFKTISRANAYLGISFGLGKKKSDIQKKAAEE